MTRGFYTAASGMYSQQRILNVLSTNITNIATSGYKRDELVTTTFEQEMAMRLEKDNPQNFGSIDIIRHPDELHTYFDQGSFEDTMRPYDMAIEGEGFFVVKTAAEELVLTRNGQFDVDSEGYLILPHIGRVQSESGDIKVDKANFTLSPDGMIAVDGKRGSQLQIAMPEDYATLNKYSEGVFMDSNPEAWGEKPDRTVLLQGAYERSNVNMGDEMTRVMAASRNFQSCSQTVKMLDTIETKVLEQLGRIQ